VSDEHPVVTERGTLQCPCGREHGFLPEEPPESPPNTFHCHHSGRTYEVDPDQCAAAYRHLGKELPSVVELALPDGTSEQHPWAGYGHRFRSYHKARVAGAPASAPEG